MSEFRFLMLEILERVKNAGLWKEKAFITEVVSMYESVKHLLEETARTNTRRTRRQGQLRWNTHAKLLRARNKRNRASVS